MALSPALSTLLDDARAEAKRAGHPAVTPLHLAAALARRAPEAFAGVFGVGANAVLRDRLAASIPAGSEQDTVALLQAVGSDDPVVVLAALKQRIGSLAPDDGAARKPDNGGGDSEDAAPVSVVSPQAEASSTGLASRDGRLLEAVAPDRAIRGFENVVDEMVSLMSMRSPATPLVRGPAGCGKSSVAVALATRLGDEGYTGPLRGTRVTRVVTASALSEDPVAALDQALDAQQPAEIIAVDDVESLLSLGSAATILPMLARLRAAACDPSRRLFLIADDAYASRLDAIDQELSAALTPIEVPALAVEQLWDIAREQAATLSQHHGVAVPDSIVRLAASPRASSDRRAHPGLLTERLDHACARAAMRPDRQVAERDLGLATTPEVAPLDADALVAGLRSRIRGQDAALRPVAARIALTRAQLDLRPGRPDGVFLFVGPTGVGKTELARALCEQLFGTEERLVRLDMSEYAEPWALSRLIGPQPGYVGFTEPEAWLTTRIRKQPETVLLLDEIEKAHPSVWNAFLQVFDAGRLSDSRGNVASFERTVIAMTSNLGSAAFSSAPIGFAPDDDASIAVRDEGRVLEAVREAMPPELINRLDELVVFQPLSAEAIEEIARLEIERLRQRLTERGYAVQIGDDVVALIATTGHDPAYGARHLQRNVERLLLEPLAALKGRDFAAEVDNERIVWRELGADDTRGRDGPGGL